MDALSFSGPHSFNFSCGFGKMWPIDRFPEWKDPDPPVISSRLRESSLLVMVPHILLHGESNVVTRVQHSSRFHILTQG